MAKTTAADWISPKMAGIGAGVIVCLLIAANLVGFELNAVFLAAPGFDKVVHFLTYVVAFVCIFVASGKLTRRVATRVGVAAVAGLLLSLGDELLQEAAPGRNVEFYDLVADWAGLTMGWVLAVRPATAVATAAAALSLGCAGFVTVDTYTRLIDYSTALRAERAHDFATARTHYLRAIRRGHQSASVYNGMAWVSVESGIADPREGVEYAQKALALDPDNPDILDTLGWALQRAGRSEEGLPYLRRAFDLKPSMFCIHYHLGQAYLALGRTDLADRHFREQTMLTGTREASLAAKALNREAVPVTTRAPGVHSPR